ncbi:MAG: hypothetical protein ACTSXQ_03525 [Alphaproteobacteria bacterium]
MLKYDGTTWSDVTANLGTDNFNTEEFFEYGDRLFIKGVDQNTSNNKVLTYHQGNWTDIGVDFFGDSDFDYAKFATYNGEVFIQGYDSTNRLVHYTSPSDTGSEVVEYRNVRTDEFIAHDDEFFLFGHNFNIGRLQISAYNGTEWADITDDFYTAADVSNFQASDILKYDEGFFVRGYDSAKGEYQLINYDGETWNNVTDEFAVVAGSNNYGLEESYTYGGELFLNQRNSDTGVYNILNYDGTTWRNVTADSGSSTWNVRAFHEYDGRILLDGYGGGNLLAYGDPEALAAAPDKTIGKGTYNVNFSAAASYNVAPMDLRQTSMDLSIESLDFSISGAAETLTKIDTAIDRIESYEHRLSTNTTMLQTRLNFTENMMGAYTSMYDNLTLVDTNEEAANLQALQIQQQLMMQALSFGMSSQANLLSLFQ